eukprot:3344713-Amphidinium_carterae.2
MSSRTKKSLQGLSGGLRNFAHHGDCPTNRTVGGKIWMYITCQTRHGKTQGCGRGKSLTTTTMAAASNAKKREENTKQEEYTWKRCDITVAVKGQGSDKLSQLVLCRMG